MARLNLSSNQLHSLPPGIGELTALEELNLEANRLQELPKEIGELSALQQLNLRNNKLRSLPPEIANISATLDVSQNPLEVPPLQVAVGGIDAVRDYFDLRTRPDAVVNRSSRASVILGRRSRWARWETRIAVAIALILIATGSGAFVWIWLFFSPLFLLRTEKSVAAGLTGYGWLVRELRIRSKWALWSLPARLMLLGLGSLLVKFAVTLRYGWRSIAEIPGNYHQLTQCVDMFSRPELIAGAEAAHGRDRKSIFVLDELNREFTEAPDDYAYVDKWFRPWQEKLGVVLIAPFFLFAWVYRWSIKATAFVYFPFLLFYRFVDEERERAYAVTQATSSGSPNRLPSAAMLSMFLLSVIGLAQLNEAVSLSAFLRDIAGDHWVASVYGLIEPWADKAIFTTLLFMSGFYLLSLGFLMGLGHSLRQFEADEHATAIVKHDAPRRWYGFVRFCWTGFKFSACSFVGVMLAVALPQASGALINAWGFFF